MATALYPQRYIVGGEKRTRITKDVEEAGRMMRSWLVAIPRFSGNATRAISWTEAQKGRTFPTDDVRSADVYLKWVICIFDAAALAVKCICCLLRFDAYIIEQCWCTRRRAIDSSAIDILCSRQETFVIFQSVQPTPFQLHLCAAGPN